MENSNREITLLDQIAYFDEVLGNDTTSKRFIIAIPSDLNDSNSQDVKDAKQYEEALILAEHIKNKMNTALVEIVTNCFQINSSSCESLIKELDYLVLLHDFWDKEEEFIINTIRNGRQLGVTVINLEASAMMEMETEVWEIQ